MSNDDQSALTVGYCDDGIVLQSGSGVMGVIAPDTAQALAASLVRACDDLAAHRALVAEVDDALDGLA